MSPMRLCFVAPRCVLELRSPCLYPTLATLMMFFPKQFIPQTVYCWGSQCCLKFPKQFTVGVLNAVLSSPNSLLLGFSMLS